MSFRYRSYRRERQTEIRAGLSRNVEAAAQTLVNEVRRVLLRGGRSGRTYRIPGGTTATYTASAPGEPPAPRTGQLANSYDHIAQTELMRAVGTPLKRGRWLEKGTRRMKPRPHFRATFEKIQRTLRSLLARPI